MPGQLPMAAAMHHQEATKEIAFFPRSSCAEGLSKFPTCFELHLQNLNIASMKHTNVQDVPTYFLVGDEVYYFHLCSINTHQKLLQNSGLDLILSSDKPVHWCLKL